MPPGWSLFSLPIGPRPADPGQVTGGGRESGHSLWGWEHGSSAYAAPSILCGKTGYWYFNGEAETRAVQVQGVDVAPGVFPLDPGWHLIGPRVPTAWPFTRGVAGPAWYWDNEEAVYKALHTGTLQPGTAYWIRVDRYGMVMDLR